MIKQKLPQKAAFVLICNSSDLSGYHKDINMLIRSLQYPVITQQSLHQKMQFYNQLGFLHDSLQFKPDTTES